MKRPNILILYTDQQRWNALGCNGDPDIRTPHLDALAKESVNFDHAFVQNPVCMPSRVSFLSGLYPSTLGILDMGVPVPETLQTAPQYLKTYGYHTANIGKLHFLPHANRDHRIPHPAYGFDHLEISDEPGCYEDAFRAWVRRVAPDQLSKISLGLPPCTQIWREAMGEGADEFDHPDHRSVRGAVPFTGRSDVSHSAFVGRQTVEWLRSQGREPFMCISGFYSPHNPWVAPQEFLDLYDPQKLKLPKDYWAAKSAGKPVPEESEMRSVVQGYLAMISEVDHYVGQIIQELKNKGVYEDTIIVFTSDHGEWLGQGKRYGKGYPAEDVVSRVPLLIRFPKNFGIQPDRCTSVVESLDVLPTLLDAAGIQIPPQLQGCSLLSCLRGEQSYRNSALTEMKNWKALRTPGYRYLVHSDGREILRDLKLDPHEYEDFAQDPKHQDILNQHRHLMLQRGLFRESRLTRTWAY